MFGILQMAETSLISGTIVNVTQRNSYITCFRGNHNNRQV